MSDIPEEVLERLRGQVRYARSRDWKTITVDVEQVEKILDAARIRETMEEEIREEAQDLRTALSGGRGVDPFAKGKGTGLVAVLDRLARIPEMVRNGRPA